MRLIVAGSRHFTDYPLLCSKLDQILSRTTGPVTILSGGAPGADSLGERYAKEKGHQLEVFPAQWAGLGKKAGPLRNEQMACTATHLVAFLAPGSKGTMDMINRAYRKNLAVRIVKVSIGDKKSI